MKILKKKLLVKQTFLKIIMNKLAYETYEKYLDRGHALVMKYTQLIRKHISNHYMFFTFIASDTFKKKLQNEMFKYHCKICFIL